MCREKKMLELREGSCFPPLLEGVNVGLVCVDGIIAVIAFIQLIRIHSRDSPLGWTRQKVFHLLIGCSNVGYFLYFVLTLVAACNGWLCWSYSCGFIAMALPKILLFAAFLLLLSFWIDLCHQADDEEEEDEESGFLEALLKRSLSTPSSNADSHRICFPFQSIHVGSRQKIVILVVVLIFLLMMTFAMVIWIGMGDNPINSSDMARVYFAIFAVAVLLLGGALACYDFGWQQIVFGKSLWLIDHVLVINFILYGGFLLQVAGLAVVSVLCFTPSAMIALFTDIPILYHWDKRKINGVYTSLLLILYYFVGSSLPSAFVLWVMRELPPLVVTNQQDESRTIAFIHDSLAAIHHPQRWTTATSAQNQ